MVLRVLTLTVSPLIFETLLDSVIFLETVIILSSSTKISIFLIKSACSFFVEKVSSTNAKSSPFLIMSFETLFPSAILTEPKSNDLPAPVSPVSTISPLEKSTSTSLINARFFTCKFINIFPPLCASLHLSH